MTDKERIRAEIERRVKFHAESNDSLASAYVSEDNVILSFIDSMQEEPSWLKELQSKIDSMSKEELQEVFKKYEKACNLKEESISENLETAAVKHATTVDFAGNKTFYGNEYDAFKAGSQWQKQQMMKDAVSGKVIARFPLASDPLYNDVEIYLNFTRGLSEGDKVKVIIIKAKEINLKD